MLVQHYAQGKSFIGSTSPRGAGSPTTPSSSRTGGARSPSPWTSRIAPDAGRIRPMRARDGRRPGARRGVGGRRLPRVRRARSGLDHPRSRRRDGALRPLWCPIRASPRNRIWRPGTSSALRPTASGSGRDDARVAAPDPIPTSIRRRRVGRGLLLIGFVLAMWLVVSWVVAYRLTHRRSPPFPEPTPAVAWGRFESHRLPTRDGQEIGAWLRPGAGGCPFRAAAPRPQRQPGNCLGRAKMLAKHGCSVLLISLRATATRPASSTTSATGPGTTSSPPSSSSNAAVPVSRS